MGGCWRSEQHHVGRLGLPLVLGGVGDVIPTHQSVPGFSRRRSSLFPSPVEPTTVSQTNPGSWVWVRTVPQSGPLSQRREESVWTEEANRPESGSVRRPTPGQITSLWVAQVIESILGRTLPWREGRSQTSSRRGLGSNPVVSPQFPGQTDRPRSGPEKVV